MSVGGAFTKEQGGSLDALFMLVTNDELFSERIKTLKEAEESAKKYISKVGDVDEIETLRANAEEALRNANISTKQSLLAAAKTRADAGEEASAIVANAKKQAEEILEAARLKEEAALARVRSAEASATETEAKMALAQAEAEERAANLANKDKSLSEKEKEIAAVEAVVAAKRAFLDEKLAALSAIFDVSVKT